MGDSMDYIHLNDMEFYGYHGALPEENRLGQRFRLTVSLATDLAGAGQTDDLSRTVNYAEVYEMCKRIVEGEAVNLIETVAETIAGTIMTDFAEKVIGVRVVLVKPDPPIPGHYASVAVEIKRGRFS